MRARGRRRRRTGGRGGFGQDPGLGGRGGEEGRQIVLIGQCGLLVPLRVRAQQVGGAQRHLLPFGDHAKEPPVPHDGHDAGQRPRRFRADVEQGGAAGRRPDDPAVEHPVERHVVDEARPRGQLVRQVHSRHAGTDDPVVRNRLGLGQARGRAIQQPVVRQLPVARGPSVLGGNGAVPNGERPDGHVPPACGDAEVDRPGFGAGDPEGGTRMLDRQAARRRALIRTDAGHGRDHADPGHIDVKLLGGDLRQRGEHALAELDLARTHLNHATRQDAQPVSETGIGRERWRQSRPGFA